MNAGKDGSHARLVERIAEVRQRFVAGLGQRTRELADLARRSASPEERDRQGCRDALRLGLHNVAGAAPTLGLHALGRKAAELEARLVSAPPGPLEAGFAAKLADDVGALSDVEG